MTIVMITLPVTAFPQQKARMCPSSLVEMNLLKKRWSGVRRDDFAFLKRTRSQEKEEGLGWRNSMKMIVVDNHWLWGWPGDAHVNAAYCHDHTRQETPKNEPEMSPKNVHFHIMISVPKIENYILGS